jgi:hypothetical protein
VQRLPQVVTRGGEKLRLASIRRFGGGASVVRSRGLRLEFADQVEVFVADRRRLGKDVVQVVTESENERQHHQHDRGDESVN